MQGNDGILLLDFKKKIFLIFWQFWIEMKKMKIFEFFLKNREKLFDNLME